MVMAYNTSHPSPFPAPSSLGSGSGGGSRAGPDTTDLLTPDPPRYITQHPRLKTINNVRDDKWTLYEKHSMERIHLFCAILGF